MFAFPNRTSFVLVLGTWILAGCTPLPSEIFPEAGIPLEFPKDYYQQLAAQGEDVFRVDPVESLVVVVVRRAGVLARLGHDHVVSIHEIGGYIAPDGGRADLYFALAGMKVDEPTLRSEAGFDTQPSASNIDGTRINMLENVLQAKQFPYAFIRVRHLDTSAPNVTLNVVITLHGITRTIQASASLDIAVEAITVTGQFAFAQTDFGIKPYSLFGGAIAVRDKVDLHFRIQARNTKAAT